MKKTIYEKINTYYLNQKPPKNIKGRFLDELFLPNNNSLLSKKNNNNPLEEKNNQESIINPNEIEWKRISDVYPDAVIYEENLNLEDINQGKIGLCYFLCSLASLIKYQKFLSQIFLTKKINNKCYYEIILFINGQFQIVIIDDYIPFLKSKNKPYFSHPNNNEIWVLLLEKAWAKVNGSYEKIIEGWPSEVLSCFTGFNTTFLINDDYSEEEDTLFYTLENFLNKTDSLLLVTTKCETKKLEKEMTEKKLIKGHTYLLEGAIELTTKNQKKIKLMKISNPWGYREWSGDYSDKSSLWNNFPEETKKKYFDKEKKKNIFFICIEDFLKYFIRIDICLLIFNCEAYCFKRNFDTNASNEDNNKPKFFVILIEEDEAILSISLISEYWKNNKILNRSNSFPSSLVLMRNNEKENLFTDFEASYNSCDDCNINLIDIKKGLYLLFTFESYDNSIPIKPNYYVTKIISNKKLSINQINDISIENSYKLLQLMFIHAIKEENKDDIKKNEIYYDINNNFLNSGIGYRIVINPFKEKYLKWINNTKDIVNMFMLYPFQNESEFNFIVYPKGEYICLGMKKNTYGSYWFNLKSTMKNYKINSKDLKDCQDKNSLYNFDFKKYLIINNNLNINENTNDSIKFNSITKKEAKSRKIYTIKEINKLMLIELRKKEPEIVGRLLNIEEPENNDKLLWVYINKENGFYLGQVKEKNLNNKEGKEIGDSTIIIREGRGAFKYNSPENLLFVGNWKDNKKNGIGKIYDEEDKLIFDGFFENDKKNGHGILKYVNGDKYDGEFVNDIRQGKGLYYWKDGSRWEGNFVDNVMDGKGIFYNNDGETYEANYTYGNFIE